MVGLIFFFWGGHFCGFREKRGFLLQNRRCYCYGVQTVAILASLCFLFSNILKLHFVVFVIV